MNAVRAMILLWYALIASVVAEVSEGSSPVPRCATDAFHKPQVGRGITILSVQAQSRHNATSVAGGPLLPALGGLDFCQVQVYLTHQTQDDVELGLENTDDKVLVEVWLPLKMEDWNARLQVTGGAAFANGMFGAHLGVAVKNGWAAVSTDGGHDADLAKRADASWAAPDLKTRQSRDFYLHRQPKWNLLHNFASRSSVDQILLGKEITEQYYGVKPQYSYWNGCSTGGRQGYAIAQKYPELLDGILANAPAISFANLLMGVLWPVAVMNDHKTFLSNCELEYTRAEAIAGCQFPEDVKNGILEDPSDCYWDPESLVGDKIECDKQEVTITKAMIEVVREILDGPGGGLFHNKFPGLAWGAPLSTLANITIDEDGRRSPNPFPVASSWFRTIVMQDPRFPVASISKDLLQAIWLSAQYDLGGLLNTDDPDLTRLRDSGTKLLTWHGLSDQVIPYQNTVNYRRKVEGIMGGAHAVDQYYRLFLAPGVEHCGGGVGPVPKDPLDALVRWVEHDEPPEYLDAAIVDDGGDLVTKEICLWPAFSEYLGIGDPNRASSWTCQHGTKRPVKTVFEPEPWESTEYGGMGQPQSSSELQDQDKSGSRRAGEILGGLKERIEGLGLGLRAD
jgi:hypothetical protein